VVLVCVWVWAVTAAHSQQVSDMILYNGKIITVDDSSFTSRLGTIAQAMHVKDGKILHIGTNDQIRPMASSTTKVIDLKGRTVIPGIIDTHEHPYDWNPVTPAIIKKVLTDDIAVTRVMDGSPEENVKAFPGVLAEAVNKAKPGEWIYIIFTLGKNYEYSQSGNGGFGRMGLDPKVFNALDGQRIPKEMLDSAAPNNPIFLHDVFVPTELNQKGIDETIKVFPDPCTNRLVPEGNTKCLGSPANDPMRWTFSDVIMRDHYPQLVEIHRLGLEWWAGYGLTAYASNAYTPSNLRVYRDLDSKGQMPVRNMWTWNWHPEMFSDPFLLTDVATRVGEGSDYLWYGGGGPTFGLNCTAAKPLPSSKLAKDPSLQLPQRLQSCRFAPGSFAAKALYDFVKAGGRYINFHMSGDEDIDSIMNIIIKASQDAGMTEEQIRAKRHGFDHGVMFPRPDQIPTMKRYGFLASGDGYEIAQASPAVFDVFGETVADWVVPKKRLVEGGIYNSLEVDRPLSATDLTIISASLAPMINRKGWDGKVYASGQSVDRETALKIATTWGSYYLLREKQLGSLEPGKFADFAVLDRDYLTIPADDIKDIRVLMTVVGGKVVHLVPSVARETGMQPAGAQVTLGGPAAQW